jgi:hypothetical protein
MTGKALKRSCVEEVFLPVRERGPHCHYGKALKRTQVIGRVIQLMALGGQRTDVVAKALKAEKRTATAPHG